jgi:hypothetical protein
MCGGLPQPLGDRSWYRRRVQLSQIILFVRDAAPIR